MDISFKNKFNRCVVRGQISDFFRYVFLNSDKNLIFITGVKKPCDVCSTESKIGAKLIVSCNEAQGKSVIIEFCSDPCMSAYKYAQTLATSKCYLCQNNFVSKISSHSGIHAGQARLFCSSRCLQVIFLYKYLFTPLFLEYVNF